MNNATKMLDHTRMSKRWFNSRLFKL